MKKLILYGVIALIALALTAAVGINLFIGGEPEQASSPITALELNTSSPETTTFQIVPTESEVRFLIDEVLRDEPVTVVGRTDQVAGLIAVDPTNPTNTTIGTIRVNARTLVTDSDQRNRALNNRILQTDQFEFIEFTPSEIQGLPEQVTLGEPFIIQVSGDLTIRDITKPAMFEITVTPVSETRLEATATTTIQRADYDLTIPDVPFVADVSEAVQLEIDFVAIPG